MKVLDLFSGIGGFSLGLERAGMKTVAFCEKDEWCRQVLKKHWPEVPIYEDITTMDGKQFYGTVDLVCGGFPCQPFSVAGRRKGKDDNRHLWPEMLRIIHEAKPRWVIGENVAGFVSMALEDVCADLEKEGYETQAFIIPACGLNAPHRRERVWITAYAEHSRRNRTAQQGSDGEAIFQGSQGENGSQQFAGMGSPVTVAYAKSARLQECEWGGWGNQGQSRSECDGVSGGGKAAWWEVEPGVGRVVNGLPRRVDRIRGLGNAVVPQIPEIIGRAILTS